MHQISRLSPFGGKPYGFVDNALRYPQTHRAINNRSGHIMCYENRTSSHASDSANPLRVGSGTPTGMDLRYPAPAMRHGPSMAYRALCV